jgi:hypothetical protein
VRGAWGGGEELWADHQLADHFGSDDWGGIVRQPFDLFPISDVLGVIEERAASITLVLGPDWRTNLPLGRAFSTNERWWAQCVADLVLHNKICALELGGDVIRWLAASKNFLAAIRQTTELLHVEASVGTDLSQGGGPNYSDVCTIISALEMNTSVRSFDLQYEGRTMEKSGRPPPDDATLALLQSILERNNTKAEEKTVEEMLHGLRLAELERMNTAVASGTAAAQDHSSCPMALASELVSSKFQLPKSAFDARGDRCYCTSCMAQAGEGTAATYLRGNPPRKYALLVGAGWVW